jgi:hypothetical protein
MLKVLQLGRLLAFLENIKLGGNALPGTNTESDSVFFISDEEIQFYEFDTCG